MFLLLESSTFTVSADLVLAIILGLFIIIGMCRGFVSQIFGFVGSIVSLILAAIFCKSLLQIVIDNTNFLSALADFFAGFLKLPTETVAAESLTEAVQALSLPSFIETTLISLAEQIGTSTINLTETLSETIARYVLLLGCFIVIVIAIKLFCIIFKKLFKAILSKLILVKAVDRILGLVVGLLKGVIVCYIVMYLINVLPFEFLDSVKTTLADSKIAVVLYKYNIFAWLFSMLVL